MNEAVSTITPALQKIKLTPAQEARFWAKVNKDGPTMPHMDTPCWVWTACKNSNGYGQIRFGNKAFYAHRIAWELTNGSIPRGEGYHGTCVLHRCDNPACCRIDHIRLGTHADNIGDMVIKGRHGSRTKPGNFARGDRNGARLHPEKVSRGNAHYARCRPELLARGETNAAAKLTSGNVVAIRAAYAAGGVTQRELAAKFSVSPTNIRDILKRNIWKHVV